MSYQNKINCRLCDKDITEKNGLLLYDYKENMETTLGRKLDIILSCTNKLENISNYCCEFCSCKIEICFNLLVEIQASDEVIKQTYKSLSTLEKVDTETQLFLCGECNATVSGIKLFVQHYENHIIGKTIVGSKNNISSFNHISQKVKEEVLNNIRSLSSSDMVKNSSKKIVLNKVLSEFEMNNKTEILFEKNSKSKNLNLSRSKEDFINDMNFSSCEEISELDKSPNVTYSDSFINGNENVERGVLNVQNDFFDCDSQFAIQDSNDSEAESVHSFSSNSSYNSLVKAVKEELEKSDSEDDVFSVIPNKNGKYDCETCKLSFEYKFILNIHLKKDHKILHELDISNLKEEMKILEYENSQFISCLYCEKSFRFSEFKFHVMDCREKYISNKRTLCQICGKMYNFRNLEKHLKEHKKLDDWTCELCGKKFKAKRFLKSHLGEHDESKKKMCEICGKKLLPLSFFSHVMKHREKRHVCQYCGKAFTYNYGLRIHLKVHQTNKKLYSKPEKKKDKVFCWLCKKDFDCTVALNKHLKNDHNAEGIEQDSRFPCSQCDKKFADMFSLKAHLKLIHEMKDKDIAALKSLPVYRYIECNVCNKVFNSENKIRIHMKQDHGLKPFEMEILKKECEKCGKKFASKQNLIHHINGAHLHIKPMTCDICHEKFAKHSSLIYHKLRHSGEKPFQCEFCQKSYRQRNDVIRHLARHVRDKELTLEEASAVNNSPSRLVIKRRIFLKDSSINYKTIVKKPRRKSEVVEMGPLLEDEMIEVREEQMGFGVMPDSMIYVEEVSIDQNQSENSSDAHFINAKPIYNEERNTIILSTPEVLKNSVKNVTYRCIPSQLKHMPAVIVKKQEQI